MIRRFLLPLLLVTAVLADAQQQQAQSPPIVRQIEIQYAGPATVSRERVVANMRTAIGKPYSDQVVEEDIRNLYATGNITNVRIFGEPLSDGVKVVVVLQTKSKVGEIIINGVTELKVKALRKEFTTKVGDTLTESNIEQDRQKILDDYQEKGYKDTEVKFRTESNELSGQTRVIFDVKESGRTIISAVDFEGNHVFTAKQLRHEIKTGPHNLLSFITKKGLLQNEQIDEDMTSLREYLSESRIHRRGSSGPPHRLLQQRQGWRRLSHRGGWPIPRWAC